MCYIDGQKNKYSGLNFFYRKFNHCFHIHARKISFQQRALHTHVATALNHLKTEIEVEVNLRPTVSRPVCLGIRLPSGACDQIFVFRLTVAGFLMEGYLPDERMGLKLTRTIVSGPCQSSHSRVQVPQNLRPYFTVSY
jgi:hypothetical protein